VTITFGGGGSSSPLLPVGQSFYYGQSSFTVNGQTFYYNPVTKQYTKTKPGSIYQDPTGNYYPSTPTVTNPTTTTNPTSTNPNPTATNPNPTTTNPNPTSTNPHAGPQQFFAPNNAAASISSAPTPSFTNRALNWLSGGMYGYDARSDIMAVNFTDKALSPVVDNIPGINLLKSGSELKTGIDPVSGEPVSMGSAVFGVALAAVDLKGLSPVGRNRLIGNAFRDELADLLRKAGRDVDTEVYHWTPFGKRYIDIEVSQNGVILGGIETKVGSSRYTTLQRLKDWWLLRYKGYIVNVARKP
jgi:hypothetical protein